VKYFVEEISLIERCDWSIGQRLQTSNKALYLHMGFRKFISSVKVHTFNRKISQNFISK